MDVETLPMVVRSAITNLGGGRMVVRLGDRQNLQRADLFGDAQLELSPEQKAELVASIRPRWQEASACRAAVDDRWFPEIVDASLRASAVAECMTCPVRRSCLAFALAEGEDYGIWGGTTDIQRHAQRVDMASGVSVSDVLDSATIRPAYLWRQSA